MSDDHSPAIPPTRQAWNKGRIVGQKRPLRPGHFWSSRVCLEMAADSTLRKCDLDWRRIRAVFAAGLENERPCDPKQDQQTCPVRDRRDGPAILGALDRKLRNTWVRIPLAQLLP